MQQAFPWLIILAVGATLAVLAAGVIAMLRHGKVDARTSNRLMRYRVLFQAIAILLVAVAAPGDVMRHAGRHHSRQSRHETTLATARVPVN